MLCMPGMGFPAFFCLHGIRKFRTLLQGALRSFTIFFRLDTISYRFVVSFLQHKLFYYRIVEKKPADSCSQEHKINPDRKIQANEKSTVREIPLHPHCSG